MVPCGIFITGNHTASIYDCTVKDFIWIHVDRVCFSRINPVYVIIMNQALGHSHIDDPGLWQFPGRVHRGKLISLICVGISILCSLCNIISSMEPQQPAGIFMDMGFCAIRAISCDYNVVQLRVITIVRTGPLHINHALLHTNYGSGSNNGTAFKYLKPSLSAAFIGPCKARKR